LTVAARLSERGIVTAPASWSPAQLVDLGAAAPERVVQPASERELRDLVVEAASERSALLVVGGGTALGLGHPLARAELAISTLGLTRTVEHSPADFVVTVEAGRRLADLQRELAPHRQWVAFEPPDRERATIGGLVASAATSLVASGHGTLRNHLLGLRVLHADGRFAKSGGRVVKNVAGYDLMKMHHGALGTLGVVVAVTLRLRPLPAADLVASTEAEEPESIAACADALAESRFLPAGAHFVGGMADGHIAGELVVRFQGAHAAVEEQAATLAAHDGSKRLAAWRSDLLDPAERAARPRQLLAIERTCARSEDAGTILLSLHFRPSALRGVVAALVRVGAARVALELLRGTAFLELAADANGARLQEPQARALEQLQKEIAAVGGAVHLRAGPPAARAIVPAFPSNVAATKLAHALRRELDPAGLFHPGRLGEPRRA